MLCMIFLILTLKIILETFKQINNILCLIVIKLFFIPFQYYVIHVRTCNISALMLMYNIQTNLLTNNITLIYFSFGKNVKASYISCRFNGLTKILFHKNAVILSQNCIIQLCLILYHILCMLTYNEGYSITYISVSFLLK